MIGMVLPTPCYQHIDIEEKFHGKSPMSSRTDSVVRGGSRGEPVKILAPVSGHTVRLRQAAAGGVSVTFERKYAERLTLARRAAARSCRASGSSTLKVMVVMGNTVIPSPGPSRPFVHYRHYFRSPWHPLAPQLWTGDLGIWVGPK